MSARQRLVLDTNIVLSAALWGGKPGQLIALAGDGGVHLFTSTVLLRELAVTLARAKFAKPVAATGLDANRIVTNYKRLASLVRPGKILAVSRDPDDDHVLACALAARANMIVSGDADLLTLKSHHGIPILRAAQALAVLDG